MSTLKPQPKQRALSRPLLLAGSLAVAVVVIFAVLQLTHTTHFFNQQPKLPLYTASQDTKGEPTTASPSGTKTSTTTTSTSADSSQPGDTKSTTGGSSTTNLLIPSGDFVSAHGTATSPVPSSAQLASVCNTTPGASCKIVLTSTTGVTKSLPAQTTDRGGSTYWNQWTPKSLGITTGAWKVQAVATLGSQTQSADDALQLEVTP